MTDPLGLSIGTTNLVAARVGDRPVTRRAVLTLPVQGAPEVGVPSGRPGEVLSGFVDRVGDPVPLVASDGSSYVADDLVVEALEAMIAVAGGTPTAQMAVAVPAHWNAATLRALRATMRTNPVLSPNGTPPRLVSDAVATLTSLRANPGLSPGGPVVLVDLGGGGTSITLADSGAAIEPLDETTRVAEFSGDLIDQALLTHVLAGIEDTDPGATAAVGLLGNLREECRQAKERLSAATATEVTVELPGNRSVVRVTRAELDALLAEPLQQVLTELDNLLQRNRINWADVSVIAAAGGGASIPLVTQQLSAHTQVPVVSTPQPALDAAVGAATFAGYAAQAGAQTGMAPAIGADAPTSMAPAPKVIPDPSGSSTFRALAWSQDDDACAEPVPYMGPNDYVSPAQYESNPYTGANPYVGDESTRIVSQHVPDQYDEHRGMPRLPMAVFGAAGVLAVVALGGVAIALTSVSATETPTPSTAPVSGVYAPPPAPPAQTPPAQLPPAEPPSGILTVTEAPPPPPEPVAPQPVAPAYTTTTAQPTTTTTPSTTTTTTTPSTTTTTTTPSTTT
ncbi:MAG: Hsp70 family protein, partial [Mycobacterium sp.]